MTDSSRVTQEEIELYLDDRMTADQREDFQRRLADDPQARREVDRLSQADELLRGQFTPPPCSVEQVETWLTRGEPQPVQPVGPLNVWRRPVMLASIAIALAAVWLLVASLWDTGSRIEPFFEPRPLAEIYADTVREGFQPYYFCEDETRFAQTFQKRQGVPLRLAELPEDHRMVGLSYLGGITRETTAILCIVEQQPVIVFVDRNEFASQAVLTLPPESELHINRRTLGELVMFEVGPFANPRMLDHLEEGGRMKDEG